MDNGVSGGILMIDFREFIYRQRDVLSWSPGFLLTSYLRMTP